MPKEIIKQRHDLCSTINDIIHSQNALQEYEPLNIDTLYSKDTKELIDLIHDLTIITPNDTSLGELVRTLFS